jgi:hypothetical protein
MSICTSKDIHYDGNTSPTSSVLSSIPKLNKILHSQQGTISSLIITVPTPIKSGVDGNGFNITNALSDTDRRMVYEKEL